MADGQTDGCMDRRVDGQTDGWVMDRRMCLFFQYCTTCNIE